MAEVDIVIRGGTLVDGTGSAPRKADVAIDKGVIVEQGEAKALFANPKEERTRQFLSKFLAH